VAQPNTVLRELELSSSP